jgi:hypothetical protein
VKEKAMLTIPEFRAAADRYLRWAMRGLGVVWLVVLVCLITPLLVEHDLTGRLRNQLPPSIQAWLDGRGPLLTALLILLSAYPAVLLLVRWTRRDPRLVCPHCRAGLWRRRYRVVVTRHCLGCGQQVLADLDPPPTIPPHLTRAEADAILAGNRRTIWRVVAVLPTACVLGFGTAIGFGLMWDAGWVTESLAVGGMAAAVVGLLAASEWALVKLWKLARSVITCPRCARDCPPEWALKFGGCGYCGQRFVAEPRPGW